MTNRDDRNNDEVSVREKQNYLSNTSIHIETAKIHGNLNVTKILYHF